MLLYEHIIASLSVGSYLVWLILAKTWIFAANFLRENVFFAGIKSWIFCYTGTHISDEGLQRNDYIYFQQNCLQH